MDAREQWLTAAAALATCVDVKFKLGLLHIDDEQVRTRFLSCLEDYEKAYARYFGAGCIR